MRMIRSTLPILAGAALALGGCAGAGNEPAHDGAQPAGFQRPAAPGEAHAARQELENEQSITADEADRMLAGSKQKSEWIPIPIRLLPDLTVVEDDRDQLLWDPSYGWYWGLARGFDVKNVGLGNAGTFHVAVLQGSDSYGFDVSGLAAGASQYFQITRPSYLGPACGTNAVIIVNPWNVVAEANYNNNVTTVAGLCLL